MKNGAFDLATNMLKKGDGKNKLVSPISMVMALGMALNGAGGDTKAQILNAFDTDETTFNRILQEVLDNADSGEKQLSFANGIWVNGKGEINKDFASRIKHILSAKIDEDTFSSKTVQSINDFVNKSTKGQIQKLMGSIDTEASMVLVNALSFDGKWEKPFDEFLIENNYDFTTEDNEVQKVTMLMGGAKDYIEINGAKGFTYAYAGGKYSFIGLLPKKGESVEKFIGCLNGDDFIKAYENREFATVNIGIPEFSFDYGMDACEILKSLGMKDAFDSLKADFSGMFKTNNGQHISNIIHKTHIELDRNGTKAAAVTGMVVLMAGPPSFNKPKEVILDRPFAYMIFDNNAKMPVFIGTLQTCK